jgi:adenylylsulfate kinase
MAGCVVWMTGLPGAGKTTLAHALLPLLEADGSIVELLDGDLVRQRLGADLGYSKADRDANVDRLSWIASRIARAGAVVVVSAISPYGEARDRARAEIERESTFFEVHVATPLSECARRDPKGLYRRAYAGEIERFTGVSDPYEPPLTPELRIDTTSLTIDEAASAIRAALQLPQPRTDAAVKIGASRCPRVRRATAAFVDVISRFGALVKEPGSS